MSMLLDADRKISQQSVVALTDEQLRRALLFMEFDSTETVLRGELVDERIIRVYYEDEDNIITDVAAYYGKYSADDCRQLKFILTGELPQRKEVK